MIQTGTSSKLASHSCINCNKWHRKCDRVIPTCGNCSNKNKQCIYKDKRKKEQQSENEITRYQPYPEIRSDQLSRAMIRLPETQNQPIETVAQPSFSYLEQILTVVPKHVNNMTSIMPALEHYFEHVYIGTPLIDRSKVNVIRHYLHCMRNGIEPAPENAPNPEDIALVYSMRAFFFTRILLYDKAKAAMDKCMEIIRSLYDRALVDYSVAATFYYIALHLMGVGQIDRAAFHLHGLDGFLKRREATQSRENSTFDAAVRVVRERYLRTMYHIAAYNISPVTDMSRLVKIFLLNHLQNKQYLKLIQDHDRGRIASSFTGLTNDEALDRFLPLADMIQYDLDNNKNTFNITWDSIDLMTSKMKDFVNQPSMEHGEVELYSKRVGFYLICQGARLQCLQRAGHEMDALARRVAEHVAYISSGSMFHFCHHNVSGPLALAIITLLRHLNVSAENEDRHNLLSHAETLISAMKSLSEKYPLVTIKYGGLISDSEKVVQESRERATKLISQPILQEVNVIPPEKTTEENTELLVESEISNLLSEFFTESDFKIESREGADTPTNEMLFL
jgi:hypothetical protein